MFQLNDMEFKNLKSQIMISSWGELTNYIKEISGIKFIIIAFYEYF